MTIDSLSVSFATPGQKKKERKKEKTFVAPPPLRSTPGDDRMANKKDDYYGVPTQDGAQELDGLGGEHRPGSPYSPSLLGRRGSMGAGQGPPSPLSTIANNPTASILGYCLASISMTVVNKYVVSGSEWNLMFLYLAIQVSRLPAPSSQLPRSARFRLMLSRAEELTWRSRSSAYSRFSSVVNWDSSAWRDLIRRMQSNVRPPCDGR